MHYEFDVFPKIDASFRESTAYNHILHSYFVPYQEQLVMMHYEFAVFPFSIINIQNSLLSYHVPGIHHDACGARHPLSCTTSLLAFASRPLTDLGICKL